MNASNLQNLLDLNWSLLKQALPSFERSLVKCRDLDFSLPISFETEESLDALSSKFSRVSDIFTQKVLKTLIFVVREDAPTFLDRPELIAIRDLRNTIAHEYLSENLVEIYMEIIQLSDSLLKAILETERFFIKIKT